MPRMMSRPGWCCNSEERTHLSDHWHPTSRASLGYGASWVTIAHTGWSPSSVLIQDHPTPPPGSAQPVSPHCIHRSVCVCENLSLIWVILSILHVMGKSSRVEARAAQHSSSESRVSSACWGILPGCSTTSYRPDIFLQSQCISLPKAQYGTWAKRLKGEEVPRAWLQSGAAPLG